MRLIRLLALTALVALVVAGCSGDSDEGSSTTTVATTASVSTTTTSVTTTSVTTTSSVPTTTGAPPQACTSGRVEPPAGAATKEVPDVDGDGKPDQGWISEAADGTVTVGIDTAAGGGFTAPFESASPVMRSVLVANVDEQGPVELLFDDGRIVQLHAVVDCAIVPVTNPEGETYRFGLGFTDVGTGVGCVDTAEGRRLVGLDVTKDEGDDVAWSRTIIELDGTDARNGATTTGTFHRPEEAEAIDLLHQVTCGTLTVPADALTAPQR
ncbi:MAG: hypothetical protein KF703_14340 [Actinobacteria bacterium]|nr:hypothetical protein [Actinomycetota bacterium]